MRNQTPLEEKIDWLKEHIKANKGVIIDLDSAQTALYKMYEDFSFSQMRIKTELKSEILFNAFAQKDMWPGLATRKFLPIFPAAFLGLNTTQGIPAQTNTVSNMAMNLSEEDIKLKELQEAKNLQAAQAKAQANKTIVQDLAKFIIDDLKEDKAEHLIIRSNLMSGLFSIVKTIEEAKAQLQALILVDFEPEGISSPGIDKESKYAKATRYQKFASYFSLVDMSCPINSWDWDKNLEAQAKALVTLKEAAKEYIKTPTKELILNQKRINFNIPYFNFASGQNITVQQIYKNAVEYIFTPSNFDLIVGKYPQMVMMYDTDNLNEAQIISFNNSLKQFLIEKQQLQHSINNKETKEERGSKYNRINSIHNLSTVSSVGPQNSLKVIGKYINDSLGISIEAKRAAKEIEAIMMMSMDGVLSKNHAFNHINSFNLTFTDKLKYMKSAVVGFLDKSIYPLKNITNISQNNNANLNQSSSLDKAATHPHMNLDSSRTIYFEMLFDKSVIQFIKGLKVSEHAKSSDNLGDIEQFKEICIEQSDILNYENVKEYPANIAQFIFKMGEDKEFLTAFLKSHPDKAKSFSSKNLEAITDAAVIGAIINANLDILLKLNAKHWFTKDLIQGALTHTKIHVKTLEADKIYRHIIKCNKEISSLDYIEYCLASVILGDEQKRQELITALKSATALSAPSGIDTEGETSQEEKEENAPTPTSANVINQVLLKSDLIELNAQTASRATNLMSFLTSPTLDNVMYKEIKKQKERVLDIYEQILILNSKQKSGGAPNCEISLSTERLFNHLPLCVVSQVDWVMKMIEKYPNSMLFNYCRPILVHSRQFSLHYLKLICVKAKGQNLIAIQSYLPKELKAFFEAANIKTNCLDFLTSYFEKKNLIDAISIEGEKLCMVQYDKENLTLNVISQDYKDKGLTETDEETQLIELESLAPAVSVAKRTKI